jgi:CheY-like chemotaxis protein
MAHTVTVLFVDDEDETRAPLAALVRMEGYRALEARNTPEALRVLEQEHIDALVTDVVMPESDGIELAERARHLQPHIHVIFATGYLLRAATAEKLGRYSSSPCGQKTSWTHSANCRESSRTIGSPVRRGVELVVGTQHFAHLVESCHPLLTKFKPSSDDFPKLVGALVSVQLLQAEL